MLPGGEIDRRHCELCLLSELRIRLAAAEVWVSGSRQYRSFEERLISKDDLLAMQQAGTLPVAVEPDFDRFIEASRALLGSRLTAVDTRARDGLLPDVTLDRGALKVAPIEKSTTPEAEALAAHLYALLPRIRITDLLAEVARWTMFLDCFIHLQTGETVANPRTLLAGLLADGLNLGLTRMAEAWHIRGETYALALRRLVNQQQRAPSRPLLAAATHLRQMGNSSRPQASARPQPTQCPLRPKARLQGLYAPFGPLQPVLH